MRVIFRWLSIFVFSIAIVALILNWYDGYLTDQLAGYSVDSTKTNNGLKEKVKGTYLLQRGLRDGDFMLLGSSELSSNVPQNPRNMFPNQDLPICVNMVGSAYTQSLLDGIRLGCLDLCPNDKVAIVVSYQWFFGDDIDVKGTQSHFSELQFYQFMDNVGISHDDKVYACQRLSSLLEGESTLIWPWLYSVLYSYDNVVSRGLLLGVKPLFAARQKLLEIKDKNDALKLLAGSNSAEITEKTVNWQDEYEKAERVGEESCTNNPYYIHDEYYDKYIRDAMDAPDFSNHLENAKRDYIGVANGKSKEYDDYRFLLKVCKEKGIEPYIIFMSVNGWFYDLPGEEMRQYREMYYDKVADITKGYSLEYLDLRNYEYEPYFYCDVMHLGWKGWLYVNEQCSRHFAEGR